MDVHVVFAERHLDEQEHHREAVGVEQAAVGLLDRVRDELVADEAAVDERVLELVARARQSGRAEQSLDADALLVGLGLDQVVAGPGCEHGEEPADPLLEALGLRQAVQLSAVVDQRQVQAVLGQRDPRELLGDVAQLGVGGAQEFAAGRGLVEQVADLDRRADVAAARHDGSLLAAIDLDAVGLVAVRRSADGADLRHRRDAGQRLSAKPERGDPVQVVGLPDLACRMRFEGGREVVGVHAVAVVADGDELPTAVLDRHGDGGGPGVDAVFDQFLDDAGRAFDHLACGDQVHQIAIEDDDATHKRDTAPKGSWRILRPYTACPPTDAGERLDAVGRAKSPPCAMLGKRSFESCSRLLPVISLG